MIFDNINYLMTSFDEINLETISLVLIKSISKGMESGMENNKINTILHDTKEKYKQLTTSLVLTSSLINQKYKILKVRQENNHKKAKLKIMDECKHLLKTSKLSVQKDKENQDAEASSNLKKLKDHARILEEENIFNLGKIEHENRFDLQERVVENNYVNLAAIDSQKKPKKQHKRKIVKGRPQMYAMLKRRKFLIAVLDEEHVENPEILRNISNKQNYQTIVDSILNKNNLLKYISCNNHTQPQQNIKSSMFDNLMKDRGGKARLRRKTISQINQRQQKNGDFGFENKENIQEPRSNLRSEEVNYRRKSGNLQLKSCLLNRKRSQIQTID